MERAFEALSRLLFIVLALALFDLAIAMVAGGGWQLVQAGIGGDSGI